MTSQPLPHYYAVQARASNTSNVTLESTGLNAMESAPPVEFGGPAGYWSPETLLVGAIADCFILSFRGTARASNFAWESLHCSVAGTLEKADRLTQFTHYQITATLVIPPESDPAKGDRLLHKAEANCLITNSLSGTVSLETTIQVR
ncbi:MULTISPECIES: OsmC family protein [Cyanophyceae]|uniref:OsmC family protein n=1 Tax=Cyanophyceae TaxID=3028117 RepID=UPI00016DCBEC|nr:MULTISPECIES: OsmC family protein [Cyanophyceae]ACB00044.1 OsmC-like protein [Picosynechococcus sp. PCC 7002]SMH53983.1 Organic hydroperoxide reductase OsmC/OhrA [Picosynechococcus sp. OG1]SMQ82815.1 Organic hydroperoxide reductase OsmC/OhrA [Synechococcus sp. 7002]